MLLRLCVLDYSIYLHGLESHIHRIAIIESEILISMGWCVFIKKCTTHNFVIFGF